MTLKECFNHEWMVGEKVWTVVHKAVGVDCKPLAEYLPTDVREATVTEVSRRRESNGCPTLFLNFLISGEYAVGVDDRFSLTYYPSTDSFHVTLLATSCFSKSFERESAEKEMEKQFVRFGQLLQSVHDSVLNELEHVEKEREHILARKDELEKLMEEVTNNKTQQ